MSGAALKQWVRQRRHPLADLIFRAAKAARSAALPPLPLVHAALYRAHLAVSGGLAFLARALWWTPLFQSRLERPAPGLLLYGGMPLVLGPVKISLGPDCRVSGQTTIAGRGAGAATPELRVGRNCDIGWQTTLAVGRRIVLGDNVRIAGRAFLAGYPGHPLDPVARAAGRPDLDSQIGDIVLEDDVWLGTGVTVSAGVTIGRATVVAAGSVVTHDLPAGALAAGVPARVIRQIGE